MASLLIVDDERVMRDNLRALFEGEGHEVHISANGESAIDKFERFHPDLVLMDVMMPKMNGYAAVKRIREIDMRVPVVFLTAKDSDADEMLALSLGAHDFISKSEECGVLLMRIKRALERTAEAASRPEGGEVVDIDGNVRVDLSTGEVTDHGKVVSCLTLTEANVLRELSRSRGSCISTDCLIAALRGQGYACEDGMLYVHVSNLRKKLGAGGDKVCNERGHGYRLVRRPQAVT